MRKYISAALSQLVFSPLLAVVLCIEFVVMISCFSICYGALELDRLSKQMYNESNMHDWYYVRGANEADLVDDLEKYSGREAMSFEFTEGLDSDTNIIIYSKSVFDNIDIKVSKGEGIDTERDYGAVPCLITSRLSKEYKIGEIYDLATSFDNKHLGRFYICGVIKNDMLFSPTEAFRYEPSAIIAYDPDEQIIRNNNMLFYVWNAADSDDFKTHYKEQIDNIDLIPFDYYYSSIKESKRKEIMPYVLLMIVFSALSVSGLIAYVIISNTSLKQQAAIFLLCGAKKIQMVLISSIRIFLLVLAPSLVSVFIISYLRTTEIGNNNLLSLTGQILAIALCLLIMIIASLLSVLLANDRNISEKVREM